MVAGKSSFLPIQSAKLEAKEGISSVLPYTSEVFAIQASMVWGTVSLVEISVPFPLSR